MRRETTYCDACGKQLEPETTYPRRLHANEDIRYYVLMGKTKEKDIDPLVCPEPGSKHFDLCKRCAINFDQKLGEFVTMFSNFSSPLFKKMFEEHQAEVLEKHEKLQAKAKKRKK